MYSFRYSSFERPEYRYGGWNVYGRGADCGDLAGRDAQLKVFHRELFLATVKGDKHLIASIAKKIRKCGQSSYPIHVGTRTKTSPRKSKVRR